MHFFSSMSKVFLLQKAKFFHFIRLQPQTREKQKILRLKYELVRVF